MDAWPMIERCMRRQDPEIPAPSWSELFPLESGVTGVLTPTGADENRTYEVADFGLSGFRPLGTESEVLGGYVC